jgi:superfamily II DNA or RNA helicase
MLKDIPFHIVYSTGENEPIEFFFDALLESKSFDLGLGYFSSTAINVLSAGFAYFINKGGKMRIIINDILSNQDKEAIENGLKKQDIYFENNILEDIKLLAKTLSKQDEHFFKCLSYLISQKRLDFIATIPANLKGGIAHNKYGLFTDSNGNKVGFNGSANFSKNALINNIESVSCYKSWSDSDSELKRLVYFEDIFNKTWHGKSDNVKIIPIEKVKSYIQESFHVEDLQELIDEENILINRDNSFGEYFKERINKLNSTKNPYPHFPFKEGPRDYQKQAYINWIENNYHGIFAMATGTGKTITSLNCVLNEFEKTGKYNVLILVPTLALVEQWKSEIEKFNFSKIIEVSGRTKWRDELTKIKNDYSWGITHNYFIITTYASFTDSLFQKLLNSFGSELILIADEAHNIGAPKVKNAFKNLKINKRIALSATPKRAYDPEGTKEIEEYFNDRPPYCYNFSMREAIDREFLTNYFYYPRLVELNEDEFEKYIQISKRLLKYFDSNTNELKICSEVEKLLLLRKQIIHKAKNKLDLFQNIIKEIKSQRKLAYCFVYVPEGYGQLQNGEKFSYIEELTKILYEISPETTSNTFLGGDSLRQEKLKGFAEGKIDVLLAMKCLDEGVDVPRAEIGIFASSTGNPRQFIQRRGRLLRKSQKKHFAYIYDMIVSPNSLLANETEFYNLERSLVRNELIRVAYFASLSQNFYESKITLGNLSKQYNLDLDQIINDL